MLEIQRIYGQDLPTDNSIIRWYRPIKFKETINVENKKSPTMSDDIVEHLRLSC